MASHRYVILRHEGVAEPHFDLMIETVPGGPLMTWQTLDWPIAREAALTKLGEHRREYLEYEGPVSNNRGHVTRVADGTCEIDWQTRHDFLLKLSDQTLRLQCRDGDHWIATVV